MTNAQPQRSSRLAAHNDVGFSDSEAAYRTAASIHYPNMDDLTMTLRVNLMVQRDRAAMAINRRCPEAMNALVEANRIAAMAALAAAPIRTLAFVSSAVDSLIFAAQQLQRATS